MLNMFECRKINKKYNDIPVLKDFSFQFPQNGLVLLFGKSGCGKTTLLNILAGVLDFDEGSIDFNGKTYHQQLDDPLLKENVAYITQDPHFIYYLSVEDNLRLCSTDDNRITELLKSFHLESKKDSFPDLLSGGEKQRLAVMQALLMDKKILLMDEPTSSLDKENKKSVFKMLQSLKENKLIICSSHDPVAKEYADEIIDFHHLENLNDKQKPSDNIILHKKEYKKRKLYPFFNKWYSYEHQKKKSKITLLIIVILSVLAMCICDTPGNKYRTNIENTYKINQFRIESSEINQHLISEIAKQPEVVEIDLSYAYSVPVEVNEETSMIISDYDMTADTLPFKKEAFPFADKIKYGSYYTEENQIILSWEQANAMGSPEDLIGQTMRLNLYDKPYDLEIVGVFDQFNEYEKQYLRAGGITISESGNYFLNGKFTQRYFDNEEFFMHGNRSYIVYCSSFQDMDTVFNKYAGKTADTSFIYADIDGAIRNLFDVLFYLMVPFVIITILTATMFYYQTQKTEFAYNKQIFGVYSYLGYSEKEIRQCLILGNVKELFQVTVGAIIISVPIMLLVNIINSKLFFIPFQIFSYNIVLILALMLFILAVGVIMALVNVAEIRKRGWYQTLIQQRDLI